MKDTLFAALFGVCFLTLLPFHPAGAQMPFTGAPLSNSNGFGHSGYGQSPALPPVAPASAIPGAAYGAPANGYPVSVLSTESIDPDHKLTRGDRLSYRVVEDRDPTVIPLIVTDSGEVDVPLINRVKAANKTTQQLTADIKSRLEQEYYYHATVVLGLDAVAVQASRGTVYVSGAVAGQGAVELPPNSPMTVSQAIAKVGGFKDFANQSKVKVIRKGGPAKGFVVDVHAVQHGDLDKDFVLQPGDQIVVVEKWINF